MKFTLLIIPVLVLSGCADVETDVTIDEPLNHSEAGVPADAITTAFSAGDSATLAVPEMSCAFMCFPKVKDTLEKLDGIEAVELVEQKDEAVIDDRRVVVKFTGDVSSGVAVAALKEAGFPDSKFE